MARKKRRGRPPGSKNRPKLGGSVAKMDVAQLNSYITSLRNILAAKIEQQRDYFELQLANLVGYGRGKRDGSAGAAWWRTATTCWHAKKAGAEISIEEEFSSQVENGFLIASLGTADCPEVETLRSCLLAVSPPPTASRPTLRSRLTVVGRVG
jgi:hypothetical protein